jgi:hypothetical protein
VRPLETIEKQACFCTITRYRDTTDFLIADLVVGRRQRPILDLHSPKLIVNQHEFISPEGQREVRIRAVTFVCLVENLSLMTAEDVKVGAVL